MKALDKDINLANTPKDAVKFYKTANFWYIAIRTYKKVKELICRYLAKSV